MGSIRYRPDVGLGAQRGGSCHGLRDIFQQRESASGRNVLDRPRALLLLDDVGVHWSDARPGEPVYASARVAWCACSISRRLDLVRDCNAGRRELVGPVTRWAECRDPDDALPGAALFDRDTAALAHTWASTSLSGAFHPKLPQQVSTIADISGGRVQLLGPNVLAGMRVPDCG